MTPLPPIEEGFYRQIQQDLYTFIIKNPDKTDIAWHTSRNALCEYLWKKGYVIGEEHLP